jgi:crossover junction endodeoxyribonuclease RusA
MTQRHVLPWPPSVNSYWRHVVIGRSVRTITSKAGREYRDQVVRLLDGELQYSEDARLVATLWVYPPDRRRRDLDNLPKAVLDAVEAAGVIADDSQIDELHVVRCPVISGGRVVVEIRLKHLQPGGDGE